MVFFVQCGVQGESLTQRVARQVKPGPRLHPNLELDTITIFFRLLRYSKA